MGSQRFVSHPPGDVPSVVEHSILLLTLQPEESLRSFLERHIYLGSNSPTPTTLTKLSRYYMRGSSVSDIAKAIGREDLYGFHQTLRDHTSYSQVGLFRCGPGKSYSKGYYQDGTTRFETEDQRPGICLECVREDVRLFGFSYWRRDHRYVEVCAKHNVTLITECPVCKKEIKSHDDGYGHQLLWKGCNGRYLHDFEAKENKNSSLLSFARIFAEIGASNYSIDYGDVAALLKRKIHVATENAVFTSYLSSKMLFRLNNFQAWLPQLNLDYRPDIFYTKGIIEVISDTYGSFSALVQDLSKIEGALIPLERCMRVEYKSAHW